MDDKTDGITIGPWNIVHRDGRCSFMRIDDAEVEENEHELKASIPLITEQEIKDIINHRDDIIHAFTKQFIQQKDMAIAQLIMSDQQSEIEQLRKDRAQLRKEVKKIKKERTELKNENHILKEQIDNFIPRRRVRRVFKQLKKILEQDGITDDLED